MSDHLLAVHLMLCVITCAVAALLLGNLWREGVAPDVTEVRFSFSVIATVTELQNFCSMCLRACTNIRNIRAFP